MIDLRSTLLVLGLLGCTGDPPPEPTVNPPGPPPIIPQALPDQTFRRPPPRDMDLTDAGDASVEDADVADSAIPPPTDAAVDAAPDAIVDAAIPNCNDDPCVLAVQLDRCDPCPLGLPGGYVAGQACVVLFNNAVPLFEYEPAACTAACPVDSLQFCNEAVGAALCEIDGQCIHAR